MRVFKRLGTVCAIGVMAASILMLSACAETQDEPTETPQVEGLTGGIAATVNGTEIQEDDITTLIENFRNLQGLAEEDAWGQWLVDNDWTPEKVREQYLDSFVDQELVRQGAQEKNIEVSSEEIDGYVDTMRSYYEDEEKWQEALAGAGTTEEKYRESIELTRIQQKLQEEIGKDVEVTDEDVLTSAQTTITSYDGAKRSSHILFNAGEEATAQEVLDRINSGDLDFTAAVEEYSQDTGSAANGGDVGWDKLNTLVSEYTTALSELEKDQVSGLVTSQYGIHIIKCTDVFTAPEELTSLDQMPVEFVDSIRTSSETTKKSEEYRTWLEEFEESADIQINDMPENAPYNVDMSRFTKTNADEGSPDDPIAESGDGSTPEGTEGTGGDATGDEGTTGEGDTPSEPNADAPEEGTGTETPAAA